MRDIKERKIGAFVGVREKEGDGSESGVSECILDGKFLTTHSIKLGKMIHPKCLKYIGPSKCHLKYY
jgi:hypothetical protein